MCSAHRIYGDRWVMCYYQDLVVFIGRHVITITTTSVTVDPKPYSLSPNPKPQGCLSETQTSSYSSYADS